MSMWSQLEGQMRAVADELATSDNADISDLGKMIESWADIVERNCVGDSTVKNALTAARGFDPGKYHGVSNSKDT
jgi:hypothetical protein